MQTNAASRNVQKFVRLIPGNNSIGPMRTASVGLLVIVGLPGFDANGASLPADQASEL
jgi:hypothetical protein